jgi:hypothetical protein
MRKHIHISLLILGILTCFALPCDVAVAQTNSAAEHAPVAGPWRGMWKGGDFLYEAEMTLNVSPAANVEGSIGWTLRASPRPNEASKIGMKGIEYVRGKFYPDVGLLILDGYRKDDPNGILGLDKYRLVVSPTGKILGGITQEHGDWGGQFFLTRP